MKERVILGQAGHKLSHYRLVDKIGEGGMGVVWKAEDTVLNRTVAVKVLPAELTLDEERRHLFLNEARLAASLSHGNIVQVYELGREGDLDFIVMEYVEGQSLSRMLHGRSLPPDKVAEIGLQVAVGLARAHRKGLIHRDLKPGNILITPESDVKIVDFGLATLFSPLDTTLASSTRTLASAGSEHTHKEIAGTLPYMSPEQVRGEKLDARSDIFSFGSVLYEMTTGQRPFTGATPSDVASAILKSHPTPVHGLVPNVPLDLNRIIEKALTAKLADRYQHTDDIVVDLRRLDKELSSGSSPSYSDLQRASIRGRHRRVAALGGLTVAIAAVAIYGLIQRRSAMEDRIGAFHSLQMTRLTTSGNIRRVALSRDGRFMAQIRRDEGLFSLWVEQVATKSGVLVIAEQESPISGVRFSPEGDYLYYETADPETPEYSSLFQIPSLGGTSRKILFDVDSDVTFSPDGAQLAFIRGYPQLGESALMVANADGSSERKLAVGRSTGRFSSAPDLAWSPDGERIAAVRGQQWDNVELVAVGLANGQAERIGSTPWQTIWGVAWLPDNSGLILSGIREELSLNRQVWQVAYPDGNARRITNDLNDYIYMSVSADGERALTLRHTQIGDLWMAPAADLSAIRQITFGFMNDDTMPSFAVAADGTVIAPMRQGQFFHLYSMESDGTKRRQLTTTPSIDNIPLIARSSPVVIFTSMRADRKSHVFKMDLDGSNVVQLTNGAGEMAISIDPQGRWALHTSSDSSRALWRVPLSGGPSTLVVEPFSRSLGFSPDGEHIAYTSVRQDGDRTRFLLSVIPRAGGAPIAELPAPTGMGRVARWSPDGKALDYVRTADGGRNLWRLPLTGGVPLRLTNFASLNIFDFDWSPDGKRLVMLRGEIKDDVVELTASR